MRIVCMVVLLIFSVGSSADCNISNARAAQVVDRYNSNRGSAVLLALVSEELLPSMEPIDILLSYHYQQNALMGENGSNGWTSVKEVHVSNALSKVMRTVFGFVRTHINAGECSYSDHNCIAELFYRGLSITFSTTEMGMGEECNVTYYIKF